jgi:hypothetical protein
MSKRRNSKQMLLDLARNEGSDVVHLPYSSEFEAVCQKINPTATTEDKHRIWEQLLVLGDQDTSFANPALATPIFSVPRAPSFAPEPPAGSPPDQEESGLLFPIHDPIDELQPWSVPREPLDRNRVERYGRHGRVHRLLKRASKPAMDKTQRDSGDGCWVVSPQIGSIRIAKRDVSQEAVKRFSDAHPKCRIE